MKILTVVSGLDFKNHTRRSTLVAIHKLNPEMDVLLYNSIRNFFALKKTEPNINFFHYHFWILEKLRKYRFLSSLEFLFRDSSWKAFFNKYEYIFIIDPNQYYLLHYLNRNHKLVYLLRDPSILQNPSNYNFELPLVKRANVILSISENLQNDYLRKYYNLKHEKMYIWSNAVDLDLWDCTKYPKVRNSHFPIAGMAGNLNHRTDLNLLKYLLKERPNIRFEISGKLNLDPLQIKLWEEILEFKNLYYHGYIPFADLPNIVSLWDVGLLLESMDSEYSSYFNHNKIYQYMALGKPFVSYEYNKNFFKFKNVAFVGKSHLEFAKMLDVALQKSKLPETKYQALAFAKENSADKRALEFLGILLKL